MPTKTVYICMWLQSIKSVFYQFLQMTFDILLITFGFPLIPNTEYTKTIRIYAFIIFHDMFHKLKQM